MNRVSPNNEIARQLRLDERFRYDRLVAMSDAEFRAHLIAHAQPVLASAIALHQLDRVIAYRAALDAAYDHVPHNGVDTSIAAAKSLYRSVSGARAKVLCEVARLIQATSDDVERTLGLKHQTVSARLYDLRHGGYLEYTGSTHATRSGSQARLHQLTDDGHRKIRDLAIQGYEPAMALLKPLAS